MSNSGRLRGLVLFILAAGIAHGEVSTRVYLRDSNELLVPVDVNTAAQYVDYGPIMVGTELSIVIDSNVAEEWNGRLVLENGDMNDGNLFARGPYDANGRGYTGSILPAAGTGAEVVDAATEWPEENELVQGFDFWSAYSDINTGDWYIIDYNAVQIGDCDVAFYRWNPPPADPDHNLIHKLRFTHIPARDFNTDWQVDFKDFSVLAGYWYDTNCVGPDWCEGTDIDNSGTVDVNDLMLFCDYWLDKTK
jgi:hypothetical protein